MKLYPLWKKDWPKSGAIRRRMSWGSSRNCIYSQDFQQTFSISLDDKDRTICFWVTLLCYCVTHGTVKCNSGLFSWINREKTPWLRLVVETVICTLFKQSKYPSMFQSPPQSRSVFIWPFEKSTQGKVEITSISWEETYTSNSFHQSRYDNGWLCCPDFGLGKIEITSICWEET